MDLCMRRFRLGGTHGSWPGPAGCRTDQQKSRTCRSGARGPAANSPHCAGQCTRKYSKKLIAACIWKNDKGYAWPFLRRPYDGVLCQIMRPLSVPVSETT
ncbi:similar to RIKEN cDNA 1300017J02, isoform CRA_a [Rattus norvegicus]|uniref:Uncharacterized protein n=1 Tax=Rattus norvegicus TaxID=10116 RepID=A6I2J3_RAT|nr:similar to RIKEN cDNA 1300017J02, isoform CRA_a [Rattus norvegicus]